MERIGVGNGEERKGREKKDRRGMGISPVVLSSPHVTPDSNPQKTKCFIARVGILCYAL